jgi:hypothetical protein
MTEAGDAGDNDEAAYERECWVAIEECKYLSPPYYPTTWIEMVRRWGAAEAARRLLVDPEIQPGFQRLIAAGRVDLTVERSVLYPRWNRIFSPQYRAAAEWRLRQAGVNLDDLG